MSTDIIVAFKVGRGGRFYNEGHKTFYGEYDIRHFTDNLFLRDRDKNGRFISPEYYCGASLESVGLTLKEEQSGVGTINIDGGYNTTYCIRLEDCSDDELNLIASTKRACRSQELNEFLIEQGLELVE